MMSETIYLNHAGTSWPKTPAVVEAVHRAMSVQPSDWPERFDNAQRAVCRFVGVRRPEQLLLTPGCTSSISTAIANLELEAGSRILTSCWEHHALHAPLLRLQERGHAVEPVAAGETSAVDLNRLEDALANGNVGLVAMTTACNVTGDLLPIREIIELSHRAGAMVLMDAAQTVGWFQLDLDALGADMVAFGGHKALQAPWGIGGLVIADTARLKCISSSCELPVKDTNDATATIRPHFASRPGYCDVGSVDQFALAGLHASIESLAGVSFSERLAVAREQAARIRSAVEDIGNIKLFGVGEPEQRLPTVAFQVAGVSSREIATRLKRNGVIAGSGLQCSPLSHASLGTAEDGVVRLSVGVRQADADIDALMGRLMNVLSD